MLDGIPFGSAGGIVGNGHSQGKGVRQLGLELGFPGMTAATVATAGISQNEQLAGTVIASGTFLQGVEPWVSQRPLASVNLPPRLIQRGRVTFIEVAVA